MELACVNPLEQNKEKVVQREKIDNCIRNSCEEAHNAER